MVPAPDPTRAAALAAVVRAHGAPNFRDLGGLAAGDGRVVAPGRLYRTSALHLLDQRGAAALADLGLATWIDLRSPAEAAATGRGHVGDALVRRPRTLGGDVDATTWTLPLGARYAQYLEDEASVVAALRDLVEPGAVPAVVGCFFGKDRTGVLVALVLEALGVARQAVLADYAASAEPTARFVARLARDPIEAAALAAAPPERLEARAATLAGLLADLDATGGVLAYLARAGFGKGEVARLRGALLVTPGT